MYLQHPVRLGVVALALLLAPCVALAQTESILTGIGAGTVPPLAHVSAPGANASTSASPALLRRSTPPPKAISW